MTSDRSRRAGFTLIEIIIVLVIMAILVGTAALSVVSGIKNANMRDAVRTTVGFIRHARAVALVKQKPVALAFEEVEAEGSFAKSRITLAFSGDAGSESDALAVEPKEFAGVHVRTALKDEERANRPKISVFSNVDQIMKRSAVTVQSAAEKKEKSENGDEDAEDGEDGADAAESSSALIEANGQTAPFVVRIWKDGQDEDTATVIDVSRFCKPVVRDEKR